MKVLILSFSNNQVNEDSFIPNKMGLTFFCVEECEKQLKTLKYEYEHICINKKNIKKRAIYANTNWVPSYRVKNNMHTSTRTVWNLGNQEHIIDKLKLGYTEEMSPKKVITMAQYYRV